MNTSNFGKMSLIGLSLLTAGLASCDSNIYRWKIDGGIAACKEHGGVIRLVTWVDTVECVDGKTIALVRP